MDSIPKLKKGDVGHVQGFILNKLMMQGCWASKGQHGKSIDLEHDLPTGYDQRYRELILEQAEELKRMSLITYWPAAGGRRAVALVRSDTASAQALPLINAYLESVGLPPLESDIREVETGRPSKKKGPLSKDELRKLVKIHRRAKN